MSKNKRIVDWNKFYDQNDSEHSQSLNKWQIVIKQLFLEPGWEPQEYQSMDTTILSTKFLLK